MTIVIAAGKRYSIDDIGKKAEILLKILRQYLLKEFTLGILRKRLSSVDEGCKK